MTKARMSSLLTALVLVLAACGQTDGNRQPPNPLEPFFLDTHSASGTPTATGPILEQNGDYLVTVEGTHSSWSLAEWNLGTCAGEPESEPQYASPAVTNGQVGMDAVWVFAAPNGSSRCAQTMPFRGSGIQISVDGGVNFWDFGQFVAGDGPNAEHSYEIQATGTGKALVLRRVSGSPDNNYGRLRVEVREATN
ncbi:MAG: hypothetical protein WDA03_08005 [Trueperaceae bacterium]